MHLFVLRRERTEAVKMRALVQAVIKQDAGPKAWDAFIAEGFPWVGAAQKEEDNRQAMILKNEVARGALRITAQQDTRKAVKSKMLERSTQRLPGVRPSRV